ncbi:MAG: hypothetical protein HN926_09390 [Chloroflexi bacterium]|nr:hypothetical protein [Chloroflexota bacterium]MBT4142496.1 hypothetical protein [Chloroflexota bacterium]MBT4943863.1 hypothetical protein [Chloroflexota bacterium]MBT5253192.1 hypothetical protein [Chloroflexota bacterium]MBT5475704.1 hypothetical protein [Chloroflexota bacterium]
MKNAWAVRYATDEVLETSVQLGVKNIIFYSGPGEDVLPGTDQPHNKDRNSYEDYLSFKKRTDSYGLELVACENSFISNPKFHDIAFGGPKRDQLIELLADEITDMGRAGIPIFAYHWMPMDVWRSQNAVIRGGTSVTAWDSNSTGQKRISSPGVVDINQSSERLLSGYDTSRENMWECLEYWIKTITPIAESADIRLGIHPDDPPVPDLDGVPRLLGSFDAYKRLTSIVDSPYNGIEFCQGTFSEMEDARDGGIYEMIKYFAERNKVLYVHFRNVSDTVPKFHEEFINTGYVDMKRAMETYDAAGYQGVFMDDHCPEIIGDTAFPGNWGGYRSRIFAQGYIQAMLEAVTGTRPE